MVQPNVGTGSRNWLQRLFWEELENQPRGLCGWQKRHVGRRNMLTEEEVEYISVPIGAEARWSWKQGLRNNRHAQKRQNLG